MLGTGKRYRRIEEMLKAEAADWQDREYFVKQVELFIETLKQLPEMAKTESTDLIIALVAKVVVGDGMAFVLRDGTELEFRSTRCSEYCAAVFLYDLC